MISTVELLVGLLLVLAAIAFIAARLQVPSAVVLVLAGIALALIPGLPQVRLSPEVVLLLILPPVIYSASVAMSWKEFKFNLRPISLLAIGCVIFTAALVAAAAHAALGFSWQLGFVLGAIVAPPDAVAPLSIARRLQLPPRIVLILEGEGLANDATALILYRFAVAAVAGATFSLSHAAGLFTLIVVGEMLWGIAVGWLLLRVRRFVDDTRIEIMLSLVTPYLAYWPPEFLGGSGVLATVTAGLYISWNGLRFISAATRLQGIFFWDFLIYLIEGMLFLLTGLQAHALIEGLHGYAVTDVLLAAAIVSVVVIVTRFVWMYPATYLPRWLVPSIARRDPSPPWQWPFVLAYTGVRGIVSLAAALALPLTDASGRPFPQRDLIIVLAFVVVLVTLVGQGLTLPWLVRALGLAHAGRHEHALQRSEETATRRAAIEHSRSRLESLAQHFEVPAEVAQRVRDHHERRLAQNSVRGDPDEARRRQVVQADQLELALIEAERELINDQYHRGELRDETRRHLERELDLRDAQLASARHDGYWGE